jgi:HEAT repeat protein
MTMSIEPQGVPEPMPLETTLQLLQTVGEGAISADLMYGLEGLSDEQVQILGPAWTSLDEDARRRIILALTEASETNFEFNFWSMGRFALHDQSAAVRALSIELLWEDESADLMDAFLALAQDDESAEVRAAAVVALGRFMLLGEMEAIDQAAVDRAQDILHDIWVNEREDLEVRRRALESLASSSHEAVEDAINEAYASEEHRMKASALFAMGRTYDQRWAPIVLEELESNDQELRFEAARAAGELELEDAIPVLTEIAFDDDVEIRDTAIWSLGEIGGREALRVLNVLSEGAQETEDEDLILALDDAIAAATLSAQSALYLMDLDDDKP